MATFVLVHGAWHGGWCWQRVMLRLRADGHQVSAPTLTGLGERVHLAHPDVDLDTHISDIVNVLEFEDLRDVTLVGHSYGGMVIAGVADRIPERLAQVIYLDAPVPRDGQDVYDCFTQEAEWRAEDEAVVDAEGEGWRYPPPADLGDAFGITDEEDTAWVRARLAPQPFKTFTQPLRLVHASGFGGPKTYIACVAGELSPGVPEAIARIKAEPGWRYRELATGHDAMITVPNHLADVLVEAIAVTT